MASYIVGLTGGIGSGKSEVSKRFEALGIEVVDADVVAREVVLPGTQGLNRIIDHFGDAVIQADGNLNRAVLRDIIFSDADQKLWLENLLHPIINQEIRHQLAAATSPYVMLASPLLLETKQYLLVNRILIVDAPESLQIARASQRDGVSQEQIHRIMASQISRAERLQRADDIIENKGDLTQLDLICEQLHTGYLTLATNRPFLV